ncbi:nitrite reductase (NADH) small subunit [uncultured Thiomicrorhabdus sp.]
MTEWIEICPVEKLVANAGVAALVNEQQIALFYMEGLVYATGNLDPIRDSNVMSRGMTGDIQGELYVASPLHKERYSLITGECLDKEGVSIPVYPSKIEADIVWLQL